MTKYEFKNEAGKAGLSPELYGAVLSGSLPCKNCYGSISGGKIVGIEWYDEWQTRQEYSYMIGTHDVTSLGKAAYVVLSKNRRQYLVEAWRVKAYVDELFRKWMKEKVKAKEAL